MPLHPFRLRDPRRQSHKQDPSRPQSPHAHEISPNPRRTQFYPLVQIQQITLESLERYRGKLVRISKDHNLMDKKHH